jgi:hypothetical protein
LHVGQRNASCIEAGDDGAPACGGYFDGLIISIEHGFERSDMSWQSKSAAAQGDSDGDWHIPDDKKPVGISPDGL